MKNKMVFHEFDDDIMHQQELSVIENSINSIIISTKNKQKPNPDNMNDLAEILFITSYPPRECGIATYSQDLIKMLNNKFSNSFSIKAVSYTHLTLPTIYSV